MDKFFKIIFKSHILYKKKNLLFDVILDKIFLIWVTYIRNLMIFIIVFNNKKNRFI